MQNYIYLDNAAAMCIDKEMLVRFSQYALEYFPNPEAEHDAGRDCRTEITKAAELLSKTLTGTDKYSVFWTNSATEAMNLVFSFSAMFQQTVITSKSEHASFENPINKINNCEIRRIKIKPTGLFDLIDLEKKLDNTVSAVALHYVQNETGAVQNICAIRELINKKAPKAILISDTVQAIGKIDIPWQEADINVGFVGAHKLGLISGGAIIFKMPDKRQNSVFSNFLTQLRSPEHLLGRIDPPVALTLADTISECERKKQTHLEKIKFLNSLLRKKLIDTGIDIQFLLSADVSSPYIVSFLLPPYQGQVLVRMLSEKGVMVSEGSACKAASKEISNALRSMGVSIENAYSVLRISFGFQSDESDVNAFVSSLMEVLKSY